MRLLAAVLAIGMMAPAVGPTVGRWTPTGGPEGTYSLAVAAHPDNPARVLLKTGTELWVSEDEGEHWSATGVRGSFYTLLYAPSDGRRAWLVSRHVLYRSDDGGLAWQAVGELPTSPRNAYLDVHPEDPDRLVAASTEMVALSDDGGVSWRPAAVPGLPASSVEVGFVGSRPVDLVVRAGTSFYYSGDGGATWRQAQGAPQCTGLMAGMHTSGGAGWVGCDDGTIWRTTDGNRWLRVTPIAGWSVQLVVRLARSNLLLARAERWDERGAIYGLFRSLDDGATWLRVEGWPASRSPLSSLPAEVGDRIVMSSGVPGPFASDDLGEHWFPVSRGLRCERVGEVEVHGPRDLVMPDSGRYAESRSLGRRWRWVEDGRRLEHRGSLLIAPHDDSWIYRIQTDNLRPYLRSHDGGRTWEEFEVPGSRRRLTVAPGDAAVLYLQGTGAPDEGYWRSDDAGSSWSELPQPVAGWDSVGVDRRDPHRLLGVGFIDGFRSIVESLDGGLSWHTIRSAIRDPRLVQQSEADPNLWFMVYETYFVPSADDGAHWGTGPLLPAPMALLRGAFITVAGHPDWIVYFTGEPTPGGATFQSFDRGATWRAIPAPDDLTLYSVVADRLWPRRLVLLGVSTDPGGVWRCFLRAPGPRVASSAGEVR